jgi:hypothetical protein
MAFDSAAIKRAIIEEGGRSSGIRGQLKNNAPQMSEGERIEMGEELERMTKTKGWAYIEAYIIGHCNPAQVLFSDNKDANLEARGMVKIMQYVNFAIEHKNAILKKEEIEK